MFNRKGFTLVELMIVVAIIGILAAIAIPNFVAMQYRSKRAELPPNVEGIKTAEIAYDAAYDTLIEQSSFLPSDTPNKTQITWPAATASGFKSIGWTPTGKVRGAYKLTTYSTTNFLVTGISDVDGDSTMATYTATKSINSTLGTANDIY